MTPRRKDGKTQERRFFGPVFQFFDKTWRLFLLVAFFALLYRPVYRGVQRRSWLENKPKKTTTGVVTYEKSYEPNSRVQPDFTYKYKYTVEGETYYGVCETKDRTPGETLLIQYVIEKPEYSREAE